MKITLYHYYGPDDIVAIWEGEPTGDLEALYAAIPFSLDRQEGKNLRNARRRIVDRLRTHNHDGDEAEYRFNLRMADGTTIPFLWRAR